MPDMSEQPNPMAEALDALHAERLPSADPVAAMVDPEAPEPGLDGNHERPAGGYSLLQRRLHWIVAGLVVLQLALGVTIGVFGYMFGWNPLLGKLLVLHVLTGTLIFGLMWKRWTLRRRLGTPALPAGTSYDVAMLARVNHYGFYVLLMLLPILGWIAYLTKRPFSSFVVGIHGALALVLTLAICAHLAGVVYHTYIRKDGLLRRMWP